MDKGYLVILIQSSVLHSWYICSYKYDSDYVKNKGKQVDLLALWNFFLINGIRRWKTSIRSLGTWKEFVPSLPLSALKRLAGTFSVGGQWSGRSAVRDERILLEIGGQRTLKVSEQRKWPSKPGTEGQVPHDLTRRQDSRALIPGVPSGAVAFRGWAEQAGCSLSRSYWKWEILAFWGPEGWPCIAMINSVDFEHSYSKEMINVWGDKYTFFKS